MKFVARISSIPPSFWIPSNACRQHPFRFRRNAVSLDFWVESKAFKGSAMPLGIKTYRRIRIRCIKIFGLAALIRKQDYIKKRHIRCREIVVFTIKRKPCKRTHQRIELGTCYLMASNREIITEFHLHTWALVTPSVPIVRSKNRNRVDCRNPHHSRKRIGHHDYRRGRCRRIDRIGTRHQSKH